MWNHKIKFLLLASSPVLSQVAKGIPLASLLVPPIEANRPGVWKAAPGLR